MVSRALTTAVLVCLCAAAQTVLSVEQLVSFMRSSIQLKHADKQVAGFLSRVKLTESLDDRTIEELQGYGAGSKTLEALRELRDASAKLPKPAVKAPAAVVKPSPIPPPSAEEQQRIIQEVRENALHYTKSLPDFICTQVTRRYVDPSGLELWHSQDVLTARLSYFDQKEDYKLILINNQLTQQSYHELSGASSTGEFGSMLRAIFEEKSHARFNWERWATLRGKRTHVFAYRVAQPNSEWRISYERRLEIIAGYRGLIYVERDTNMALRITLEAEDIPPSFPVQQASTMLDYDYSQIGDRDYLLPLRALIRMRDGKILTKNDVQFRLYRKFATDAVITYDTPQALSQDQTEEQPTK